MRAIALAISIVAGPGTALADDGYFGENKPEDEISFRLEGSRTTKQRLVVGSLFGGAAIFAGLGAFFHVDSRSKSNEVGGVGDHTGEIYTRELDDTRKDALLSRNLAIGGYAVGGLFLVGAIVALYMTDPGTEVVTVGDEKKQPADPVVPVSVVPLQGGAVIGGTWRF